MESRIRLNWGVRNVLPVVNYCDTQGQDDLNDCWSLCIYIYRTIALHIHCQTDSLTCWTSAHTMLWELLTPVNADYWFVNSPKYSMINKSSSCCEKQKYNTSVTFSWNGLGRSIFSLKYTQTHTHTYIYRIDSTHKMHLYMHLSCLQVWSSIYFSHHVVPSHVIMMLLLWPNSWYRSSSSSTVNWRPAAWERGGIPKTAASLTMAKRPPWSTLRRLPFFRKRWGTLELPDGCLCVCKWYV